MKWNLKFYGSFHLVILFGLIVTASLVDVLDRSAIMDDNRAGCNILGIGRKIRKRVKKAKRSDACRLGKSKCWANCVHRRPKRALIVLCTSSHWAKWRKTKGEVEWWRGYAWTSTQ